MIVVNFSNGFNVENIRSIILSLNTMIYNIVMDWLPKVFWCPLGRIINEGLDGGSGIHYSLKNWPTIHLIKSLGYSLK